MKILKTKISRGIFIAGIFIVFICFHFTDLVDRGGVEFDELFKAFGGNILYIPFYIGIIFGIPLILSILIPAIYKWIKSGD